MSNDAILDFSGVDSAEGNGGNWLRPGVYNVKPSDVELVEKEGVKPRLKISFTPTSDEYSDAVLSESFFLSEKALPRLQYLHEKYLGFKLENKAITLKQLEEYFKKKLLVKPKTITIKVDGEQTGDKVYARLPFTDFIIEENVEEGAFEEDSAEYKKAVKKGRNASTGSNAAVLSTRSTGGDSLPWNLDN